MAHDPPGPKVPARPERAEPRFAAKFSVNVACKAWAQVEKLVTLNASRGGVFLRGDKAPEVGTTLRLDISLPDGQKLAFAGSVVHVVTPEMAAQRKTQSGFGVRIDSAHAADLVLLESMARSYEAPDASVPEPIAAPSASEAMVLPDGLKRPSAHVSAIEIVTGGEPIAIARVGKVPKLDAEIEDVPCRSEVVVGIDYGTSYSTIAAVRGREAVIVRDAAGRWLVPSVVSYPETGGVLIGWDARERIAIDPAHTLQSAKRLLGRRLSDPQVANYLAQQAYRTDAGHGDQVVIDFGNGAPISIPQTVGEVLRMLKRRAEQLLGIAVEDAVLACPVTFDTPQRNALRKAAQLAGLRVVGMLDEPAAAALAYGFGQGRNEVVAVYDFGGGTFDFTLIDISNETFRILSSAGEPWLGGDDFDLAVATQVANEFWKQHKIELQKRLVEWQKLLFACEAAKRVLSESETATVEVAAIARTARGPIDLRSDLSRERFEQLCQELVNRSIDIVAQSLEEAGLEPSQVGQVVLTSGVTRTPMVRGAVAKFFDRDLAQHVHPEEAVALGAAIQGAFLAQGLTATHGVMRKG